MKKFGLLITLLTSISFAQPTDLFFSEYIEGSSNNKALEIFNGTTNAIDLGANVYNVQMYFNGSSSPGLTINLTGTITAGDVFVLAQSSADAAILAVADQTNGAGWYNGDDAVVLRKGTTILDVIGQIAFDPGTEWGTGLTSTADNTLRRKLGTTAGDANGSDAFDPIIEWDGYANDTFDGLGNPSPLPVELSSFSASVVGNTVKLNWRTETEVNNYGFDIERSLPQPLPKEGAFGTPLPLGKGQGDGLWTKIGFVNGNGNSNSPKSYSFTDANVLSGKYSYRLKQIDNDGQFEYSKTIEVDLGTPTKFELAQNFPNPFNPETAIRFTLPTAGNVRLTIYNLLGQEVKSLVNAFKEAGTHIINFNASEFNSGVYIYKLEANGITQTRKMTLIK